MRFAAGRGGNAAGVRVWPAGTVMVDAMMTLGHDGADNIARQASVLMDSGWVIQAPDFEPPMLSSAGVAAAMRTPDPFISPAVFAATEDAIRSHAFEDSSERFDSRIRKRVLRWTEALPSDLRRAMMASLDRADGARRMPTFGAQRSA